MSTSKTTAASGKIVEAWRFLKPLLEKVFSVGSLSMNESVQMQQCVHRLCATPAFKENAREEAKELYRKLQQFLKNHAVSLRRKIACLKGTALLSKYADCACIYMEAAKSVDARFSSLNKHWIKAEYNEGFDDIKFVHKTALLIWLDELFDPYSEALIRAILDEIEKERMGERIERGELSAAINSLINLGRTLTSREWDPLNQIISSKTNEPQIQSEPEMHLYRFYLERSFLSETARFYEVASNLHLARLSIPEYLKWVESCEEYEKRRVDSYLHKSTLNELMHTVKDCLIKNHISTLAGEFTIILEENSDEDLLRLWKALSGYVEGEDRLAQQLETYVLELGSSTLRSVCEAAKSSPKVFVETIVKVLMKCKDMIERLFCKHPPFTRAINKGCESLVNHNAITEALGSPQKKTPELLAKYADILLRKGPSVAKNANLEEGFSHIMEVFRYVEDKDLFVKVYTNLMVRRLVHNKSVSEDAERSLITHLTSTCGQLYTHQLQCMLNDSCSNRHLNRQFSEWLEAERRKRKGNTDDIPDTINLSVMVLASNNWPLQQRDEITLPVELEKGINIFTEFYKSKHGRRKLSWCYHECRGEILSLYTEIRHTFLVSTHQMSILVLFNNANCYTVSQIGELTKIEEDTLHKLLKILLEANVLVVTTGKETEEQLKQQKQQTKKNSSTSLSLTPETHIALFFKYTNNRFRVNLNLPLKSELKREAKKAPEDVEQDCRLAIQACIARIMKARKKLDHKDLVKEVTNQMPSRFNVASQIKSCIEHLIENDFIRRDLQNMSSYEYVA